MKTYLLHYHDKCESPAELLLYNAIVEEIGITPSVQLPWKCCNRKTYRLDFAYPAIIAPFLFNIEVDGVIYHNCRIQKDKWRDEALKMDNVIVIRITGKFIYKDPNAAAREVIEKMQSFNNRLKKEYIDENEGIS
ncbi:hypothetical protein [Priestia megaterium]|uniref:hypothetical protein n=1 Tax=Priestia megaterium TaxID=1404 RepID=UPI00115604AE|nr:hypothetical protein [Priestia megaterium]